jgi:hypothetical protein
VNVVQEYWLPINALTAIMFPIIAFFEITRLQGFARTGKVSRPISHWHAVSFLHVHFCCNMSTACCVNVSR